MGLLITHTAQARFPPARGAAALALIWVLSGCATTTDCVTQTGNPGLTPATVAASGGHTGERQRWGGTLAATRHLPDSTELTIVGYPLDDCGRPRTGEEPQGRFILSRPGFLETADRPVGSRLTATGMIVGVREESLGAAPLRHPILQGDAIRWWSAAPAGGYGTTRPWVTIGIGGGSGGVGGGIGVSF
jgi:outer membrane lipoprotein